MASNNFINDFEADLQLTDEITGYFRFIDPRSLGEKPKNVHDLLGAYTPPTMEQYASKKNTLIVDQMIWLYAACQILHEFIVQVDLDKRAERLDAAQTEFASTNGWNDFYAVASGVLKQLPSLTDRNMNIALTKMRSLYGGPTVGGVNLKDFKNDILYKFPENTWSSTGNTFLNRRFVHGVANPVAVNIIGDFEGSNIYIEIIDGNLAPSPTVFGFTKVAGEKPKSSDSAESLNNYLNDVENKLQANNIIISGDTLKPTNTQRDFILREASDVIDSMVVGGELNSDSIEQLRNNIDQTLDNLLQDPNSPYHNKGYTKQDLIELSKEGLLGSEGVSELANQVSEALQSCIDQVDAADQTILFIGESTYIPEADALEMIEGILKSRKTAVNNYTELYDVASTLYSIKGMTPGNLEARNESNLPRQNPSILVYVGGAVVLIAGALAAVVEYNKRAKLAREEQCKNLLGISQAAHLALSSNIQTMLIKPNSLDTIFKQIKDVEISNVDKLRENECMAGLVKGLDCRSTLISAWNTSGNDNAKRQLLSTFMQCLDAQVTFMESAEKNVDKQIEQLKEESILEQLQKLITDTTKSVTSVFTYAAYTALGLGVIWGATKIYKSLKSDSKDV